MAVEAPKSSRDALHHAMLEIGNLRRRMPGAKAAEILSAFEKVEDLWDKQDIGRYPFNVLSGEMNTIKVELRELYDGELDSEVTRQSPVFDQLADFDHRIRIYNEWVVSDPIYIGLEKRLQRIDEMLPVRNYAVGNLLGELRTSFDPYLKQRLNGALGQFCREEYELVIGSCGKAEGALFFQFRKLLENLGIGRLSPQIGPAIGQIREMFRSRPDANGLALAKSGRLENLVLSMFEMLHYFRNLSAHDRTEEAVEEKLPRWQVERREFFIQKPEYARLVLMLTFQIALELQALVDHQEKST
jgi:hypothetical protein